MKKSVLSLLFLVYANLMTLSGQTFIDPGRKVIQWSREGRQIKRTEVMKPDMVRVIEIAPIR